MPDVKMPSITLSQLRNTRQLLAWLRAGKTVELRERKTVIAYIAPWKPEIPFSAQEPAMRRRDRKGRHDIGKILRRVDKLPVLDSRSADEIIGYDENGVPSSS